MTRNTLNSNYPSFVLCLLIFLLAGPLMAHAQELPPPEVLERLADEEPARLDVHGNPIEESDITQDDFAPGQLIVRFKQGTINLPPGQERAQLAGRPAFIDQIVVGAQEVAVQFKSARVQALRKVFPGAKPGLTRTLPSGKQVAVPDLSQIFLLDLPQQANVLAQIERFEQLRSVLYAEPNYYYRLDVEEPASASPAPLAASNLPVPNDPRYDDQYALDGPHSIEVEGAWDENTGGGVGNGGAVKIAILDSGIDYQNEDLGDGFGSGNKVVDGWDYFNNDSDPRDDMYHGTHVAGIAGALTNNFDAGGNREGIAGVAGDFDYDARDGSGHKGALLYALKLFNQYGGTPTLATTASQAIRDAAAGGYGGEGGFEVDVLNNSWGDDNYSETIRAAVNFAAQQNSVFVAARGNDGDTGAHYPSGFDGPWVISVGATDQSGGKAGFSSYGGGMDVVAPGADIISTMPTTITPAMQQFGLSRYYDEVSGTSMATPQVAGLAALLIAEARDALGFSLHPEEVQGIIRATAKDKGSSGYDQYYGAGLIQADRALERLHAPYVLERRTASGGSDMGESDLYVMVIYNNGIAGFTGDYYWVQRHTIERTVSFSNYYPQKPDVWCRGANETIGWSAAAPNYQTGYCEVVSVSSSSARLRTYIYEVWEWGAFPGDYLGYFPTTSSNVQFAYTVSGVPGVLPLEVSLSGPTSLQQGEYGTWTANLSNGMASFTYTWYWRPLYGSWQQVRQVTKSNRQDYYSRSMAQSTFDIKVEVSDSQSETDSDLITVVYDTDGGDCPPWQICEALRAGAPLPTEFALEGNYPNPFSRSTRIDFALPEATRVELVIYDMRGRKVATLIDAAMEPGFHHATFEAQGLPSGVYLYRIRAGEKFTDTGRMVVVR